MEDIKYKVEILYGHSEPKIFYKKEGESLVCYSYRIDYDRNGIETNRTKPEEISRLILQ